MMKTKLGWAMGALLVSAGAQAAIGTHGYIEGVVGNISEKSVELTVSTGTTVEVPRASIQSKEEEVHPGHMVIALVDINQIKPVAKKTADSK